MRQFSAAYLDQTRSGMWDSREALADLDLPSISRTLDVGAGTGVLTRVLREETDGQVIALDGDCQLLDHVDPPRVCGDGTRLPIRTDVVDLVICQALLINLANPTPALREFVRVSSDVVGAIEPDNASVTVESTVEAESTLAAWARSRYLAGTTVDPTLGGVREHFETVGLEEITVRRYDHVQTIEPPYSQSDLTRARRLASGEQIDSQRDSFLAAGVSPDEYDAFRTKWRSMGREVIEQMRANRYRRTETVPFFVTVGHIPEDRVGNNRRDK